MKNKKKTDHHHACTSGQAFETDFATFIQSLGLTVLKLKRSFAAHGLSHLYHTLKKIAHPTGWDTDVHRKSGKRGSESDGVILEYHLAFEHKGGKKAGTAENKIWWEFVKVMFGITPNYYLYVFAGRLEDEYHATHFTKVIDMMRESGNENFKHVYCVKQSELTREWLDARFERRSSEPGLF